MTVYTALESAGNLTVKFHINPVDNYTVHWSMGNLVLPGANVKDTVKDNHVQTTYYISDVTNKHLGNYTVHVINTAIKSEPNKATFNVLLKEIGKKSKPVSFFSFHFLKPCLFLFEHH